MERKGQIDKLGRSKRPDDSKGKNRAFSQTYGVRDFTAPDVGEGTFGAALLLALPAPKKQELMLIQQLAWRSEFYTVAAQRVH
jgi:hypothetical protein